MPKYENYFKYRNIDNAYYENVRLPAYFQEVLPLEKEHTAVLDIGCGFGQILQALKKQGYTDIQGVDISSEAVDFCKQRGLNVTQIRDLKDFCTESAKKYDFVILSHVLEHLEKIDIIPVLMTIRKHLLTREGKLVIMVPNAQSNTGCYWAYEDFTHTTLFTSGSLYYVLRSAGYSSIDFLDPDGLSGARPIIKQIRIILLALYRMKTYLWNIATNNSFHRPSPQIFTYELKVFAR